MFITEHGTMPAPRKSSISSNEYMEIRRQQNKDAQRRWREKKKIERETEAAASSSQNNRQGKTQKVRSRKASTSTASSGSPQQQVSHTFSQDNLQPKSSHTYTFHQFNLPHPAYAPALHHPHSRTECIDKSPSFDKQRRLSSSPQYPPSSLARLTWSEMIELAYHHSTVQQGTSSVINLPSCNFAQAFVENARMMGLDIGYACDPSSSSSSNFIARDWTHYQHERRFDNQKRKNSIIDPVSDVSNASPVSASHSPKDTLTEKGFIRLPPPFTLSEKRLPWDKIPKNMHPTEAQLRIDHHPFIDIAFPWPSMREKILTMLANDIIDQADLYEDCFLSGLPGSSNQELAFLAWGTDLSDPFAWEISERFAQKWWFLLDEEMIYRSNWWRKQRGLPALRQGERKTRLL